MLLSTNAPNMKSVDLGNQQSRLRGTTQTLPLTPSVATLPRVTDACVEPR